MGEKERALQWAERALEIAPKDPQVNYNLACFYSRLREWDSAMDRLETSVRNGMAHREWILNDGDLAGLRDNPRFVALVESMPS
jgi:adenylate cyclase